MSYQHPFILSIDQGTTSSRAIVFSRTMDIVNTAQKELKLHYPENGWVEQDAMDIWDDTLKSCRGAIEGGEIDVTEISAIGITNQRETTIVWNKKTGKPIYNAIVWQDRRTADYCRTLKDQGHEEMIREKTGLLIDSYFSATKIKWILDNVDGARALADRGDLLCGTVDTWLVWKLTGGASHVTDATNASRTMLFNIQTQKWDTELLALFDIPSKMLPVVKDNVAHFGDSDAELFGGKSIPITGMAGDQQAALIGQACFAPGMIKSTYGTGCFALMNIGEDFKLSDNRLLTTVAYRFDGKTTYALEGSIFVAGAAIQWLRDQLQVIKTAGETADMVHETQDNGGVYLVPAFTGMGAPYWDPDARASITGLTRDSGRAHIVRAALEAQAYQTRDLTMAMEKDAGQKLTDLRVDGGMVVNDWMCQFLADMTDVSVERPPVIETTALGAAYLAGMGAGWFGSVLDISSAWRAEKQFTPNMGDDQRQKLYAGWQLAVKRTLS